MEICYILDASAFINGFKLNTNNNFTIPEITAEIKDFQSRLALDMAIDECKLTIQDVPDEYINCVNKIISESGDILRLSFPDKKLIALAYMLQKEGRSVKLISDDYSIQNTLKIMNIPYSGVMTQVLKEFTTGKRFVKAVKRNMVMIILLMTVKFVDQKSIKKELR